MIARPPNRPRASYQTVINVARGEWAKAHPGSHLPAAFVLVIRGYYSTTIGKPGNDLNVYDDAIAIVDYKAGSMTTWNANADPARYGWNPNAKNYMARLQPGVWTFIRRLHRGKYLAWGQGENPVTVDRLKEDGTIAKTCTGRFGIDLHLGGANGVSSEGCLTVPPDQWLDFDRTLLRVMKGYDLEDGFSLILVDGPIV